MKTSEKGLNLIKEFEGFRSKPYLDAVKIPTIGYGNTYYPDGTKVRITDNSITEDKASEMLKFIVKNYEDAVNIFVTSHINQNQFDALVSFAYNVGIGNLKSSTLLKKVNKNPNDKTIAYEFSRWNKAGGKILKGLTARRKKESYLYFS